ncbi:MAG: phage tail tape-measure protein [Burkholderiaceae bacterium]|nr:phage tail tape-measure protein [Burkholderiaceae bacterium]
MATPVGSVMIEMAANVAKLQSDMGKATAIAEAHLARIDQAAGIVKTSLTAIGAGLLAGASFDAIKSKIDDAIKSAADMQQLSERTGVAADKLSALAGVAKLSGTDTESLATGMQKLSKSMIDAQNGGEKTSNTFKAIGISAADLKGKDPGEVFKLVADKLDKYQDGAEKVVVMQNLMGKSGANLLPLMKDLVEVGELQAKVTAEQAAMADEYDKNQVKLAASQNAVYKMIAMEALPVLNAFTKAMLENINGTEGVRGAVKGLAEDGSIRTWAEGAAKAAAFVVDCFDGAIRTVQITAKTLAMAAAMAVAIPQMLASGSTAGVAEIWNSYKADIDSVAQKEMFSAKVARQLAVARTEAAKAGTNRAKIDVKGLAGDGKATKQKDPFETEMQNLERTAVGIKYVIDNFDKFDGKVKESKEAMARFDVELGKFSKESRAAEGLPALSEKQKADYIAKAKLIQDLIEKERQLNIVKKFGKDIDEFVYKENKALSDKQFELDIMGKATLEQMKLTEARRIDMEVQDQIRKATVEIGEKNVAMLNDEIARIQAKAAIAKADSTSLIEAKYYKEQDPWFNLSESVRKYGEDAANVGKQAGDAMTNSIKSMEDALVTFVTTGKMNWKSLADTIIAEIARIQIKSMLSSIFGSGAGGGGLFGSILSLFTGAGASGSTTAITGQSMSISGVPVKFNAMGYAEGGDFGGGLRLVGEKGPELEVTGPSRIFNAKQTQDILSGGSGGATINYAPVINIDSRTDRNEVYALVTRAVQNGNAQLVDRLQRQGRLA